MKSGMKSGMKAGMTAGEALQAMAALPLGDLRTILRGRAPLVLAPHADDESLGCGGLLAASASSGGRPAVLVLTDGTGSHPNSRKYPPGRLRDMREGEARTAAAILGVASDRIGFLRLRDTGVPTEGPAFAAAVDAIGEALADWGCGVLLAPWRHDPHGDHVAAHLMAQAAAARTGVRHLAYPVWGLTLDGQASLEGGAPEGWRLDISAQLGRKRRAIGAHKSQYAGLIKDDPAGFQMSPAFMARFEGAFEMFLSRP